MDHIQNNHSQTTLVMCHAYGDENDVHSIIRQDNITTCQSPVLLTNIMYYKGGAISVTLDSASNYLKDNFKFEIQHKKVICFPPENADASSIGDS